jgi:glucose-6-phosphate dehydrogenase assembly protein OpcA
MGAAAGEVRPEQILKDLEALWVELGQSDPEKRNAVLRACSMTLLVALDAGDDEQEAAETVAELMHEHPSRSIVLKVTRDGSGGLDARVLAQCWMPFGRRQQICCERIEITAAAERLEEVPRIILGVTAPDLPVVLWCRGARLCREKGFGELAALADKLIVDSAEFASAEEGLEFVRKASARKLTADLAWTRVTAWREMVALLFDCPETGMTARQIERVRVVHGGSEAGSSAAYLAGWLRVTLGGGVLVTAEARREEHDGIVGIEFEGDGMRASVSAHAGFAMLRMHDREHRVPFPPQTLSLLLREELGILDRDVLFEESLG